MIKLTTTQTYLSRVATVQYSSSMSEIPRSNPGCSDVSSAQRRLIASYHSNDIVNRSDAVLQTKKHFNIEPSLVNIRTSVDMRLEEENDTRVKC
jgi:hypothetical protein